MNIKKADTFGQKDEWRVDPEFLELVCKKAYMNGHAYVHVENVENIILTLVDMGYLNYENN